MTESRGVWPNGWIVLAIVALACSNATSARGAQLACATNQDCNCTQEQEAGAGCDVDGGPTGPGGICTAGMCICNSGFGGFNCDPIGACCTTASTARATQGGGATASPQCTEVTEQQCDDFVVPGTYQGDFTVCSQIDCLATATPTRTPTATATQTATATPTSTSTATTTNTPASPGQTCEETADCAGGLVCDPEELVCCDRFCNEPLERCDLPGLEGTCSPITAPAPAASHSLLLMLIAMLLALGGVAIARRGWPRVSRIE